MMYRVIYSFRDLQDNGFLYTVGSELSTNRNGLKRPFIEAVPEPKAKKPYVNRKKRGKRNENS